MEVIGSHPDKGKQGIVQEVIRAVDKVLVEGVNERPRMIKGDREKGTPPRMSTLTQPIHSSNVMLVCPVTNKPTRIYRTYLEDGTKVRISKKSGAIIPRPEILALRRAPISDYISDKDTLDDDAWKVTYNPTPYEQQV